MRAVVLTSVSFVDSSTSSTKTLTGSETRKIPAVASPWTHRARSGLALRHGLVLPNAPGTIDSDYRGEIQVLLLNAGSEPVTIRRGDRIAQLLITPVATPEWEEVDGPEGLGSTSRGPWGS